MICNDGDITLLHTKLIGLEAPNNGMKFGQLYHRNIPQSQLDFEQVGMKRCNFS